MPSVNWSFDRKLLNTYYALGTVLGAGGHKNTRTDTAPGWKERHRAKSSTSDNAVTVLVWVVREKQRQQEE